MIEPAIKYKNELSQAFAETYGQEKYKYYYNSYFEEETISTDDWQRRQFAVTYNNKVIGYIAYSIERDARIAHHVLASIIDYEDAPYFFYDISLGTLTCPDPLRNKEELVSSNLEISFPTNDEVYYNSIRGCNYSVYRWT